MSEETSALVVPSDAELIDDVRTGDSAAFGELFARHRDAATRLARQLVPPSDADDLVAEAFSRMLDVLQRGGGPDVSFRAYLLTSIRRLHVDRIRAKARVRPTDNEAELDRGVEFVDTPALSFERSAAAEAFATLPERWQLVLWHLDVEGQKPAEVAPLLGMTPNGVSALAYRAREGLRQAYLQRHLTDAPDGTCRWTTSHLGAHVRGGLSPRDSAKVESHLDECRRCLGLSLELAEVNNGLAGVLAPALLGAAASGYLAGGAVLGGATATGAAAGAKALLATIVEPLKAGVTAAGAQAAVAATVLVSLVAAGALALTTGLDDTAADVAIDRPPPAVAAPPAPIEEDDPPPTVKASAEPSIVLEPSPDPITEPSLATDPVTEAPGAPTTEPTSPTTEPSTPVPTPEPTTTTPPPPPPPPPPAPTDVGVGTLSVRDEPLLGRRRLTVPITSTTTGTGTSHVLTLRVEFRQIVLLARTSAGWRCGGGHEVTTLVCTQTRAPGPVEPFAVWFSGLRPSGRVVVSAEGDPNPGNASASFSTRLWGLS